MNFRQQDTDDTGIDYRRHSATDALENGRRSTGARVRKTKPHGRKQGPPPNRRRLLRELIARAAVEPDRENAAWVLDNFRLILGSEKEAREFAAALHEYPVVVDGNGTETPRVRIVARGYLLTTSYVFTEADLVAFVDGYQTVSELSMEEVWALKPALELELLDRLTDSAPGEWPTLLTSLRKVGDTIWKELFEMASSVNPRPDGRPVGPFFGHGLRKPRPVSQSAGRPGTAQSAYRDGGRAHGDRSMPAGSARRSPRPRRLLPDRSWAFCAGGRNRIPAALPGGGAAVSPPTPHGLLSVRDRVAHHRHRLPGALAFRLHGSGVCCPIVPHTARHAGRRGFHE